MPEPKKIEIKFEKEDIRLVDGDVIVALVPCRKRNQEDAYCYLLGAIPREIVKAVKGAEECLN